MLEGGRGEGYTASQMPVSLLWLPSLSPIKETTISYYSMARWGQGNVEGELHVYNIANRPSHNFSAATRHLVKTYNYAAFESPPPPLPQYCGCVQCRYYQGPMPLVLFIESVLYRAELFVCTSYHPDTAISLKV